MCPLTTLFCCRRQMKDLVIEFPCSRWFTTWLLLSITIIWMVGSFSSTVFIFQSKDMSLWERTFYPTLATICILIFLDSFAVSPPPTTSLQFHFISMNTSPGTTSYTDHLSPHLSLAYLFHASFTYCAHFNNASEIKFPSFYGFTNNCIDSEYLLFFTTQCPSCMLSRQKRTKAEDSNGGTWKLFVLPKEILYI